MDLQPLKLQIIWEYLKINKKEVTIKLSNQATFASK